MFIDLKPLKRGQWRSKSEDYKPVTSNQGEFKTKAGGEVITGFTKHKSNGRMRVFEDTDGDGRLSRRDQLIAKGRVEKEFRGTNNPLDFLETGKVKEVWERQEWKGGFPSLAVSPVLEFKNSDGDLVGRFNYLQTFPNWEGCPTCF